ncbi:MAG: outer membrane beta-barrel protein [Phycisphaerae bacterium]|nr:outer membrane beta-barrel protein [Gemmatimonadaceae bacterium]
MRTIVVRVVALFALSAASAAFHTVAAQTSGGAWVAPYAGYMMHGAWYDGPLGTNVTAASAPVVGAQIGVPLVKGVSLTGNLAYSSGDLEVGLPILGGVSFGKNKMWLYDAAIELGGLTGTQQSGIAPFVQGGIGGMTNEISNSVLDTRSTNLAYIAGVGVDMRMTRSLALRLQARDYIGRFDSREAVGFKVEGNLAHNWALSAGVKLAF